MTRRFETRGGSIYEAGTLWLIDGTHRGRFSLQLIEDAEKPLNLRRKIRQVEESDIFVCE